MKIISLGYTCYIKTLINATKYNKETDIFDWINSFYFNKLILSLENKFDIFNKLIKSPIKVDLLVDNVFYNEIYSFRLPHEVDLTLSKDIYNRRLDRFMEYKTINESYLFIRIINYTGRYNVNAECINENYNEDCYNRLMTHLPMKSKILLITHHKLSTEDKSNIFYKFYVVDNIINPDHISYGNFLEFKPKIIKCYESCFEYIDKHFDNLDVNMIQHFITNSHINL